MQLATCQQKGLVYRTCAICSGKLSIYEIEKLPHVPSDWITDVEPTVKTEGTNHKECTTCLEVLEEGVIPKIPNDSILKTDALLISLGCAFAGIMVGALISVIVVMSYVKKQKKENKDK